MTAVPPLDAAHPPAKERKENASKFNYYPLLGILLALAAAGMIYGGILLLVDNWSFLQFGEAGGTG